MPVRRSPWVLAACGVAAAGVLAGCGQLGRNINSRELVVVFNANATAADAARVRAACPGKPPITAQPKSTSDSAANRRYPLRYNIGGTTVKQQSALIACLGRDPSVATIDIPDMQ